MSDGPNMLIRIFTFAILIFKSNLVLADQTDERLDMLFGILSSSSDLQIIRSTESEIWEIWFAHPNSDVERLMQIGVQRMNTNRQSEAMLIFNELIENFPDYAEAWNRRATLHYLLGNYQESIGDIEKVLALEPRHFGALSGLGLVYLQLDQLGMAKQAFEDLLDVHPNSPNARENLKKVDQDLRLNVI
tara:strand:+ start:616 stop:1182 length:567 start_codon:yes stop_codon:yes gene_type:complete